MYTYVETAGRDSVTITLVSEREYKGKAEACDGVVLTSAVRNGAKIASEGQIVPYMWFVGKEAFKKSRLVAIIIDCNADAKVVECDTAWMDHDDNDMRVTNIGGKITTVIAPEIVQIMSSDSLVAPKTTLWDFSFKWTAELGDGVTITVDYHHSKFSNRTERIKPRQRQNIEATVLG